MPQKHYEWKCKYCPEVLPSRRKLWEHHKICPFCPHDSRGRVMLNKDDHKKRVLSLIKNIKEGATSLKGRKHTTEELKRMSNSTSLYLESIGNHNGPRFSKKACDYIDELNKEKGWNLQHALNGGEFKVGRFYLDGYDKNLNIAFEYDEAKHHLINSDKDSIKTKFIKHKLKCKFFRYSEFDDELKEV